MVRRYRVTLTESERDDLRKPVSVGKAVVQKLVRARILLLADQSEGGSAKSDPEIVEALGCGRASVERIRKRFVEDGLDAALVPKPSLRIYERKLDGKAEAQRTFRFARRWANFARRSAIPNRRATAAFRRNNATLWASPAERSVCR